LSYVHIAYICMCPVDLGLLALTYLILQCGILDITQPYRPPQPVTGIALLFFLRCIHLCNVHYTLCSFVYSVLFERAVLFCVVSYLVPLPPGKTHLQLK
jgi:hypothetical protein